MPQVRPEPKFNTLPVGRYSYTAFKPNWDKFQTWLQANPWVKVETEEKHLGNSLVDKLTEEGAWKFYIFRVEVPFLAVWTNPGFPDSADANVQTSDDTVSKPDVPWFQGVSEVGEFLGAKPIAGALHVEDSPKAADWIKTALVIGGVAAGIFALAQVATIVRTFKN